MLPRLAAARICWFLTAVGHRGSLQSGSLQTPAMEWWPPGKKGFVTGEHPGNPRVGGSVVAGGPLIPGPGPRTSDPGLTMGVGEFFTGCFNAGLLLELNR